MALLWDQPVDPIPIRDTHVTAPEEIRRLSRQCQHILERLQRGEATNKELAGLSLKYTARISDLRAAGYDVQVKSRNTKTGLTVYRLVPGYRVKP